MRRPSAATVTRWITLLVTLVVIVAAVVANAAYTNRVDTQSDRDWCRLLATLDQPSPEPTTERGRKVIDEVHKLREKKGCLSGNPE